MPVGIYKTKNGKMFYFTGNKIAELLRKAVWKVHPETTPDNLRKYSACLLHVWVCILLDEAGKSLEFIKKRLCWLGNSFGMYLRDTAIIQHQHLNALQVTSQEVMDLITALPEDDIALCNMTDRLNNLDLHKYGNDMD
jgi:hypothetical protein